MVGNPARAWGVEKDLVQTSTVVKRDWGASCLLSVWYNCLWELHQQPSCLQTYSRTLNKMPTVELIRKFTLTSALGNAFRIKTDNSHRLLLFSTYFHPLSVAFSVLSCLCTTSESINLHAWHLVMMHSTVNISVVSSSVHQLPAHALEDLIMNCKTLPATEPSLIKVWLVIAHWRIWGDNKVWERKWLLSVPVFLRLTSLFSFLSRCCVFCLHPEKDSARL